MPLTPGLVPNIRQTPQGPEGDIDLPEIMVEMIEEGGDMPEVDDAGNILRIEHGDGSVTVSLDGRPIEEAERGTRGGWFDNLIDEIDNSEVNRIVSDLMRGIEDDLQSRKDWIEDRAMGIKLMGLKVEIPGLQGASDGAPVEGMSKVRHPLLRALA